MNQKLFCLWVCFIGGLTLLQVSVAQADGGAENSGDLGKIVVTASRMAQHDYKIAGNVTVIGQKEIAASNAQNVPDLLKEHLGVFVYDNNTTKSAVIDIRGFGDTAARNILVLVNDRKINNIDISGPDLSRIPLASVERVEIIRGAGSVLYGDNAVGGVVNIITKKGRGKASGRVGAVNGSYHATGTDVEVSGSRHFNLANMPNDVHYYLYSKYFDSKGYRINSDLLAKDFNLRLGYDVSDRLAVDVSTGWHEDDQGLPGGLTTAEIKSLGRRGSSDQDDFASTKDRFVQMTLDIKPWPENIEWGKFTLDLYHRDRDVYDAFFAFGEFSTKRNIEVNGVSGKYIFNQNLFNREVNFVTGVDFYENENDILGSGSNVDDLTISKDEWGMYGYLQYQLWKELYINGGTRYYKAQYQFTQRNVAVDAAQDPDEWVSMGGAKWEYAKGSNLHFNIQQTFRFLSTDEWYSTANFPSFGITPGLNTALKQQTGMQYEAGLKHNYKDKVTFTLTPYVMYNKNEIFFDPLSFANSNYEKTRRFGIEAGKQVDLKRLLDIAVFDKLTFFTNYDYQDARFLEGTNDGKKIPFVPQHQVSQGLTVGFLKHYDMSLVGKYVGSRFAINDTLNATDAAKPFYALDWKIRGYFKNFEIYAAINNLTSEKYFTYIVKSASSTTKEFFPAPERNYTAGMSVRF